LTLFTPSFFGFLQQVFQQLLQVFFLKISWARSLLTFIENPELGYISFSSFVADAVRRRLEELKQIRRAEEELVPTRRKPEGDTHK